MGPFLLQSDLHVTRSKHGPSVHENSHPALSPGGSLTGTCGEIRRTTWEDPGLAEPGVPGRTAARGRPECLLKNLGRTQGWPGGERPVLTGVIAFLTGLPKKKQEQSQHIFPFVSSESLWPKSWSTLSNFATYSVLLRSQPLDQPRFKKTPICGRRRPHLLREGTRVLG